MPNQPLSESTPKPRSKNLGARIGLILGPALFLIVLLFFDLSPDNPKVTAMAAVAILMAVWWITEAIPLAATSLLPLVLFPLLGIDSTKSTAPIYVNYIIFLYLGGFLIALAMERWGLHKRIALTIIRLVGGGPSRLVLSFMISTAFLSMWISNTATTIMMLAIGLAIIKAEEAAFGAKKTKNLSLSLLIGIAYSASVGGIATLVGTPPNLSLTRIFEQNFPDAEPLSFGQWILFGLPVSIVMLGIIWLLLTKVFFRVPKEITLSSEVIRREHEALGRIKYEEVVVLVVFALTAILWVFRTDLTVGSLVIPGWTNLLPERIGSGIDDGTIAVIMALSLFFFPARNPLPDGSKKTGPILDAAAFKRLPWHIVLLFGGGFSLAAGFKNTGLSEFIGQGFTGFSSLHVIVVIAMVCLVLTFLTELTSNTATTEMILPILAAIAVSMEVHPLLLMVPATVSASCAFMMPVATPPNAIVFGSGRIRIPQMALPGLVLNIVGAIVITVMFFTVGRAVFKIEPGAPPEWARSISASSEE